MSFDSRTICGNTDCPCGKPGRVCDEFMPYANEYCARCGWERRDHE